MASIQAESLLKGLDIENAKGPLNIEVFGGSPDDNNAYFFYNGAMSVLKPYLDSGKLVVVSGQMGMDKVGTLFWDGATAQARMDNLLSAFYTDKKIDGVLSPNDSLAIGVISSLKGVGYGTKDMPMPIITGQDAEVANIKAMLKGEQYSTVFKDTRALAGVTVGMVDAILNGGEPEINDTKTYDNGEKIVSILSSQACCSDQRQLERNPDRQRILFRRSVQGIEPDRDYPVSSSFGAAVFHLPPFLYLLGDRKFTGNDQFLFNIAIKHVK